MSYQAGETSQTDVKVYVSEGYADWAMEGTAVGLVYDPEEPGHARISDNRYNDPLWRAMLDWSVAIIIVIAMVYAFYWIARKAKARREKRKAHLVV